MKNVITIFRKEVAAFFNSLVAYIVMVVFLTGIGLFFWVFGQNVMVTQKASMDALFANAPWLFLFLIPAITMRSFSEEFRSGTIEFLSTKPVTDWQIILGKYFASVFLIVFSLIPTLIYYISLQSLGKPPGNLDTGPIWGAYIGLVGLGSIFAALGIFSSSLTENQVVAFILSVFFCFMMMFGWAFLADMESLRSINYLIDRIGINAHYESISLGVVDTRDILYFFTMIFVGLLMTKTVLGYRKS